MIAQIEADWLHDKNEEEEEKWRKIYELIAQRCLQFTRRKLHRLYLFYNCFFFGFESIT